MVLTAVRASGKCMCTTHAYVHWHISFCTHFHSVTAHAAGKLNHADEVPVTDGVALPLAVSGHIAH